MQEARLQRLSVLIVDDNHNMRELVRTILQALGVVNIYEGRESEHAITKIRDFSIDLVVTDWVMEPKDGLDLVKWIRTSPDSPDNFLPIIMVTGHTEKARITEARDAGINEFMAKPISARALYRRLVSVIEHPRQFVRPGSYFGPDRRRKVEPFAGADRRGDDGNKASAA
ncbi:MAG: response regulator [Proteobacteria bacterium]|nr:response regulator [Pseudomonadota bacterium]